MSSRGRRFLVAHDREEDEERPYSINAAPTEPDKGAAAPGADAAKRVIDGAGPSACSSASTRMGSPEVEPKGGVERSSRELISSLRAKLREAIQGIVAPGSRVALLDFPRYRNVGDSAIWLGERRLLTEIRVETAYTRPADLLAGGAPKEPSEDPSSSRAEETSATSGQTIRGFGSV